MTEHAPLPDEFRTMAACEALGIMLPVFKRYDSLVTLIIKEIFCSVYEVMPTTTLVESCSVCACLSRPTTAERPLEDDGGGQALRLNGLVARFYQLSFSRTARMISIEYSSLNVFTVGAERQHALPGYVKTAPTM